jgi:hypothetical protein
MKFFRHSGDVGDIIYALPTIKALGGGVLMVGSLPGVTRAGNGVAQSIPLFQELCVRTGYVFAVVNYMHGFPDLVDLDGFRETLGGVQANGLGGEPGLNIAEATWRAHRVGAHGPEHHATTDPPVWSAPWLKVDRPERVDGRSVVFARSPRYRNPAFPWRRIWEAYGARAVFLGLPDEHRAFEREVGAVPHLRTADLMEAARIIAGAELFVGNQSALYAVAEGLKARTIQETCPGQPNCIFPRPGALHVKDDGGPGLCAGGKQEGRGAPRILHFIPTLSRADLLNRNMPGLLAALGPGDHLIVLDNSDGKQTIDEPAGSVLLSPNRGVAGSWNMAMDLARRGGFDALLILQDDIKWTKAGTDAARRLLTSTAGVDVFLSHLEWSVQLMRASAKLPRHDERFRGWCGDDDYAMELTKRGLVYRRFHELNPAPGSTVGGTPKEEPREVTMALMRAKWGTDKFEVNNPGAPWYHTNEHFTFRV